jgi:hypothetical protein
MTTDSNNNCYVIEVSTLWVHEGGVLVPLHPQRHVRMMLKHRDPKTVMRYDHGRENLDQNAVIFLGYDEE